MLQYIDIENLALLETASLEFEAGFTAITGETGAGKSVFLGALNMLSGARIDKSIIRQNKETCKVDAGFHFKKPKEIDNILSTMDLPICEDGDLLISRSISNKRMPKIIINGQATTLGNLQKLGAHWIDFHGPGEPQKLFHEKFQLQMLDSYSKHQADLKKYAASYDEWRNLKLKRERISQKTASNAYKSVFN